MFIVTWYGCKETEREEVSLFKRMVGGWGAMSRVQCGLYAIHYEVCLSNSLLYALAETDPITIQRLVHYCLRPLPCNGQGIAYVEQFVFLLFYIEYEQVV